MKKLFLCCGILAVLLIAAGPAPAKTEWKLGPEIELDEKPIDTAITADGKTAYILTKGSILIYNVEQGQITDAIPLEKKYNSIGVAPKGGSLLLTRGTMFSKSISVMEISQTFDLPIGTSPIIGKPDAPVTLTVFTDYQCPYCSREFPVTEQLLKKYPDDLKIVIKHFPLQRIHKFASQAAVAALAADNQGKYQELSRIMFKNYKNLNEATLAQYAEKVGLDLEKFEQDRKNKAHKQQIQRDRQLARKANVRGVPSLFINGRPVKKRSLQAMAAMIEAELKKE